jgi:hypothetical protein
MSILQEQKSTRYFVEPGFSSEPHSQRIKNHLSAVFAWMPEKEGLTQIHPCICPLRGAVAVQNTRAPRTARMSILQEQKSTRYFVEPGFSSEPHSQRIKNHLSAVFA